MLLIPFLLLCLPLGLASPLWNPFDFLTGKDDKGKKEPAVLELPYGSYKSEYDEDSEMSVLPLSCALKMI